MRKLISILLVVLLLVTAIACDPESGTGNDVTFDVVVSAKKDVKAEANSVAYVDNITKWTYTAVKGDDGYTTGETKEETDLKDGDLTLSLGHWTITVNGYSGENKTYTGTFDTKDASITADTKITVEVKPVEDVKDGDIKFYSDFAKAMTEVKNGGTVTLIDDVILKLSDYSNAKTNNYYFVTNGDITLDLGGHTLKSQEIRMCRVFAGTLTIKNGTIEGDGDFEMNNNSIIIVDGSIGNAGVRLEADATVKAPDCYGITVAWSNADSIKSSNYKATVDIYGTIESCNPCVASNGTKTNYIKSIINIYDGAKLTKKSSANKSWNSNDDKTAVYQPSINGELTISGGTIICEDGSAVEIRTGKAVITGGTFTSKASAYAEKSNSNGSTTQGAGIAVATYGNGDIDVTIEGVKFGESTPAKFAVANPNSVTIGGSGKTVKVAVKGDFTVADFAKTKTDVSKAVVTLNGETITIPKEEQ